MRISRWTRSVGFCLLAGCPVIEFVGAHDYMTPSSVVIDWFKHLHASSKRLVIFADSAHMTFGEQPGRPGGDSWCTC